MKKEGYGWKQERKEDKYRVKMKGKPGGLKRVEGDQSLKEREDVRQIKALSRYYYHLSFKRST